MKDNELKELIDRALGTEYGIEISTSDPVSLRRRFYALRVKSRGQGDSSLDLLTCRIMSDDTVHIVNQGGSDAQSE